MPMQGLKTREHLDEIAAKLIGLLKREDLVIWQARDALKRAADLLENEPLQKR